MKYLSLHWRIISYSTILRYVHFQIKVCTLLNIYWHKYLSVFWPVLRNLIFLWLYKQYISYCIALYCLIFMLWLVPHPCIKKDLWNVSKFHSILFYSILFYSIPFHSILFILFYSILFYSIFFFSFLFYSIHY